VRTPSIADLFVAVMGKGGGAVPEVGGPRSEVGGIK
jgi:hypothetical protein